MIPITPPQLARLWGVSPQWVRHLCASIPPRLLTPDGTPAAVKTPTGRGWVIDPNVIRPAPLPPGAPKRNSTPKQPQGATP